TRGARQDQRRPKFIEAFEVRTTLGTTVGLRDVTRRGGYCYCYAASLPPHPARAFTRPWLHAACDGPNNAGPGEGCKPVIISTVIRVPAKVTSGNHASGAAKQAVRRQRFAQEQEAN